MIAIIGAGASGLVAAITLAREGKKVRVYEKNSKIGKKILATGNGRCNITNQHISVKNFHGANPSFVNHAINQFDTNKCKKFFSELGIEMVEGEKGRLYPASLQASSVVELLSYEAKRLGVEFLCECEVSAIEQKDGKFFLHVNEDILPTQQVLVATGGLAMPNLGANESGHIFAKKLGHNIIPPFASLTQLETEENLKEISGVKVQADVEVYVDKELVQNDFGDVLFTNYGVSGSCILDISRVVSEALMLKREVVLKIDLAPNYTKEQLKSFLKKRQKIANAKSISLWLDGFINSKLAKFISKKLSVENAAQLGMKDITKLVFLLKDFKLHVKDTKGFKSAEVSAGGVDVSEVSPSTLCSKLHKGLFFSGEVLDIDGDCGGYNLHWAWASGYLVAKSMVQSFNKSQGERNVE